MTYKEFVDSNYFLITKDNYLDINVSHLFGYCMIGNAFYRDCDLDSYLTLNPDDYGYYIAVLKEQDSIRIIQDVSSYFLVYVYTNQEYWAISNSFWKLCECIECRYPLTVDINYCEQFFSSGLCPLSLERTLSNEIKVIPPQTELIIKEGTLIKKRNTNLITHKVPADSMEGLQQIDEWIGKWASFVKTIYDAGYQIKMDITGGFDSRISLAIALKSGIDLNADNVYVYSRKSDVKDIYTDCSIANQIAEHFGFVLKNKYAVPNGLRINAENAYYIYKHTLFNCHREPYFPRFYYEKPMFYLNGLSGETIRGFMSRCGFLKSFQNPTGISTIRHIPTVAQRELMRDYEKLPDFNENHIVNSKEQDRYFYGATRNRYHFGMVAFQNYLLNIIQIPNLSDTKIINIGLSENVDPMTLYAIILHRTCPELLNFPFEGNRTVPEKDLKKAVEISSQYPPNISIDKADIDFSKFQTAQIKTDVPSPIPHPETILDNLFQDEKGRELFFGKFGDYGTTLYNDAKVNLKNSTIKFPRQYESVIAAVISMLFIEERSKMLFRDKVPINNTVFEANHLKRDISILEELMEKYPDIDLFKAELMKVRKGLLINKPRADMEIEEDIYYIRQYIDLVCTEPSLIPYFKEDIHQSFRTLLLSKKISKLGILEKQAVYRRIRMQAKRLPDTRILTHNSVSMKLFVNYGIVAFRLIDRIKKRKH